MNHESRTGRGCGPRRRTSPAVAASLAPYEELLAEAYCEGIARIELMQKSKGLDVKN